jgi:hypothetical protein
LARFVAMAFFDSKVDELNRHRRDVLQPFVARVELFERVLAEMWHGDTLA